MTDTIIYLHGKESTPETSSSARAIAEHFKDCNVLVPDYQPLVRTYAEIEKFLTEYIKRAATTAEGLIHVVGISLGGYWAYTMACRIAEVYQCILLNPSFRNYLDYPLPTPPRDLGITVIANLDDEVLDPDDAVRRFQGRGAIITFPRGGHRFANRGEMLRAVERAVNTIAFHEND